MSATDRNYLSCAETAKLIRKALKADFPGVRFSVRSHTYAGGASIDVSWEDGPTEWAVRDKTLWLYSGATFDGMTDMKSYHDSMVMTDDGPKVVHFGADFVFANRHISAMRESIARVELERFLGRKLDRKGLHSERVNVSVCGRHGQPEWTGQLSRDDHCVEYASTVIGQVTRLRPWNGEPCPGSTDVYCVCGRWQKGHESEPHLR
jgi:hypothetical protein